MRILIIEDDEIALEVLKKNLEAQTFAVDTAPNGEKGSFMARVNDYDTVLLDDTLPKKTSTEVCREIRDARKCVPIIIISNAATMPEKVAFLREGADDHITKPFCFEELLARIEALLRRPPLQNKPVFDIDNIKLDPQRKQVTRGERRVYLTKKEFALLEYLMRNKGAVLSRSMIMEHVWDNETDPFSNTIESHIRNLRKKIGSKRRQLIYNVPGRGYKIDMLR